MIADYLRDTRLLITELPELTEPLYIPQVYACETICSRLPFEFDAARREVVVTYSAQRKCELVELGKKNVLVYDRNLGQILNTFNRILFFGKKPDSAYRPLFHLLLDEAILIGRSDLAAFFFGMSMRYENTWSLPQAASDPFVQTQTWLQELFIIAHEYCHLLMTTNEPFRDQRIRVGKIIWEPDSEPNLDQIRTGLLERYGEALTIDEIAAYRSSLTNVIKESEADLVEELGCDDFAFHILSEYGNPVFLPPVDFFKAAFLVLRHVRAINYVRTFIHQIAEEASEPSAINRRVVLLQARQHLQRSVFPPILDQMKSHFQRAELKQLSMDSVDKEIGKLSDLHDDKIDNVLLFRLFPNVIEEFREWRRKFKRIKEYDFALCRKFASARDWVSQPEKVAYVTIPLAPPAKWPIDR